MADSSKTSGAGEIDARLQQLAEGLAYTKRSPILHSPKEAGLEWEDVHFPSADGTLLEGWFIPKSGSEKLIVCLHPFQFSRSGFPSHVEPWKSAFGPGNDFELNFVPEFKILHEAGYNVLAFDFRNFGHSSAANGGLNSNSRFEARDVCGALAYVRSRPDLAGMKIGLLARCMGANATFRAFAADREVFAGVRCLVAPLLLSTGIAIKCMLEGVGLAGHDEEIRRKLQLLTGTDFSEGSPLDWAPAVDLPTLTYGVHDDTITKPSDLEAIYEAIGTKEKKMFWIHGTSSRWDGYTYFQRHPNTILNWFDKYMS